MCKIFGCQPSDWQPIALNNIECPPQGCHESSKHQHFEHQRKVPAALIPSPEVIPLTKGSLMKHLFPKEPEATRGSAPGRTSRSKDATRGS